MLLHGRDPEKGGQVLSELRRETGNEHLEFFCADFASLAEVRRLAEEVKSGHRTLDILINNAGIGGGAHGALLDSSGAVEREHGESAKPRSLETSRDGYELRFAVNYLAGFLLTNLLLPELMASPAPRVVAVSSIGQSAIDFDDVMLMRGQDAMHAYRQSKFAQVMFTFELAERLKDNGVTVVAVHPASFMDTKMVAESGITPKSTIAEGADAIMHAAVAEELIGAQELFLNGKTAARSREEQAYDPEARRRFWDLSAKLSSLPA